MDKEVYKQQRLELHNEEVEIDKILSDASKRKHEIHVKERELTKQFVLESGQFPFVEGKKYHIEIEKCETPTRKKIECYDVYLNEISCYSANLSEIGLYFHDEITDNKYCETVRLHCNWKGEINQFFGKTTVTEIVEQS